MQLLTVIATTIALVTGATPAPTQPTDVRVQPSAVQTATARVPLAGTMWIVDGIIDDGAIVAVPKESPPYLVIRETGQTEAYNGCNWMTGTATVHHHTVDLTAGGMTKRLCPDYPQVVEAKVTQALDTGTAWYRLVGDRLTLIRRDGKPGLLLHADPAAEIR